MPGRQNDPRNAELEARIASHPDDDTAWQIYADWLSEQSSPRGELAALQLARAKKRLPSLRKKIEALLEKHGELFYGKWHADNEPDETYYLDLKWRAGFWERGKVNADDDESIESGLGCGSARLMRSLETSIGSTNLSPIVASLAKHGPFPLLRSLRIGDVLELGQSDVGNDFERTCKGMAALPAALPALRTLFLCMVEDFDFGDFPKLTKLHIASMPPARESMKALFAADLPRLRSLELTFAQGWYGSEGSKPIGLTPDDLAPLASGKIFPKLAKLAIHGAEEEGTFASDMKRLFEKSALKDRLEILTIDDEVHLPAPDE